MALSASLRTAVAVWLALFSALATDCAAATAAWPRLASDGALA